MSEPTFQYPNGYRVTYDVGNGLEYADSTAWSGVTATISPFKTGASSPLVYAKITQYGSPTLPTLINELFHNCRNLVEVEFDGLDASKVTRIDYLFSNNYALTTIKGLETLNCSNVINAHYMFRECRALTAVNLPIGGFPKCTMYESMFTDCVGLTELDLSTWNTSLAINTRNMHHGCSNLVTIYVGDGWDMSAVTTGATMFIGCTNLVGAVPYNASQTGVEMANWTTGYLTYKSTAEPAKMLVSGAGSTEVNGIYTEDGVENGKPVYKMGEYRIRWNPATTAWQIISDAQWFYMSWPIPQQPTPDLVEEWEPDDAEYPAPTVTLYEGDEPEAYDAVIATITVANDATSVTKAMVKSTTWREGTSGAWNSGDCTLTAGKVYQFRTPLSGMDSGATAILPNIKAAVTVDWDTSATPITTVGTDFMSFYANGCSGLTSLGVPDTSGLTSVGNNFMFGYAAFCPSLTSLGVPDTSGLTSVGNNFMYAYAYECTSLTSLAVPDTSGLTTVGDNFMYGYAYECTGLTSLAVPDTSGLTTVGTDFMSYYAYNCSSLTSLGVPDTSGLTTVGTYFMSYYAYNCSSLTSLGVPDTSGLTTVGNNFMYCYARNCSSLTSLGVPDTSGLTTVGTDFMPFYAHNCSSLTSLGVPDTSGLTTVGDNFMYGYAYECTGLTSLAVPDTSGLTTVGTDFMSYYASGCTSLTSLSVPDTSGLTTVGNNFLSFYASGCSGLTSLAVPDTSGLTSVGNNFMYGYAQNTNALTALILPPTTGWFENNNVNWNVASGRLGILKGVTPNAAAKAAWDLLTVSGKTLYTNYIQSTDNVIIDGGEPEPQEYTLEAAKGTYTLSGANVTFTLQRNYTLDIASGSYTITGEAVDFKLQRNRKLEITPGSYNLTGTPVNLITSLNKIITLDSGEYSLSGKDVGLSASIKADYVININSGFYSIDGTNLTFNLEQNRTIGLENNIYSLLGRSIGLSANIYTPTERTAVLKIRNENNTGWYTFGAQGPQGAIGMAGIEWQGEWQEGREYLLTHAVFYQGSSYVCTEEHFSEELNSPDKLAPYWVLLSQRGLPGPQGDQGAQGAQGLLGSVLAHAVHIETGGFFKIGNDGEKNVDLTGIQIDSEEIVGQQNGVTQVRIGTDGKLYSGAGNVVLDINGVKVRANGATTFLAGNLNGEYGVINNEFGFAAGDYASNQYIAYLNNLLKVTGSIDATSGSLSQLDVVGSLYIDESGNIQLGNLENDNILIANDKIVGNFGAGNNTRFILGNLKDNYGESSNKWGLGIGVSDGSGQYIKYADNTLTIQGNISARNNSINIGDGGIHVGFQEGNNKSIILKGDSGLDGIIPYNAGLNIFGERTSDEYSTTIQNYYRGNLNLESFSSTKSIVDVKAYSNDNSAKITLSNISDISEILQSANVVEIEGDSVKIKGGEVSYSPVSNGIPQANTLGKISSSWLEHVFSTTPVANGIPQANSSGQINSLWLGGVLSETPIANGIPLANSSGKIDPGWIAAAPLPPPPPPPDPPVKAYTIPANALFLAPSGATIAGTTAVTNLYGFYTMGAATTDLSTARGAATHSHNNPITQNSAGHNNHDGILTECSSVAGDTAAQQAGASFIVGGHSHGTASFTNQSISGIHNHGNKVLPTSTYSNLPKSRTGLKWVKSNTTITNAPINTIVMDVGGNDLGPDWKKCDGKVYGSITTPDLRGLFISPTAASGYSHVGSSAAHTHTTSGSFDSAGTHTHTVNIKSSTVDYNYSVAYGNNIASDKHDHFVNSATSLSAGAHTHTIGVSGATANVPPFILVTFWMRVTNNNPGSFPAGVVFGLDSSTIPEEYSRYDDAIGRVPRGAAEGQQLGSTGGSSMHSHTVGTVSMAGEHFHGEATAQYNSAGGAQRSAATAGSGANYVEDHSHTIKFTLGTASNKKGEHSHPLASPSTTTVTSLPPYKNVMFIIKTTSSPDQTTGGTGVISGITSTKGTNYSPLSAVAKVVNNVTKNVGVYTVDVADFGLPTNTTGVVLRISARWEQANSANSLSIKPTALGDTTLLVRASSNITQDANGTIPIDNGSFVYSVEGATAKDVILYITGYFT